MIILMRICDYSIFVQILGVLLMSHSDCSCLLLHVIWLRIIWDMLNSRLRVVVLIKLRLRNCITNYLIISLLRFYCCHFKCCVNFVVIVLTLVVIYLMRYSSCCEYCSLWGRMTCIVWLRWIIKCEALEIVKGALEFL